MSAIINGSIRVDKLPKEKFVKGKSRRKIVKGKTIIIDPEPEKIDYRWFDASTGDVFDKDNKKISSIGAIDYSDYATYIKTNGLKYADNRKRLYKIRHEKTRKVVGSKSYYADQILWT